MVVLFRQKVKYEYQKYHHSRHSIADFHITSLNVLFDAVQRIAPLGVLENIVIVINR